ncbi:MAG: alpha/beta fold hydrolase [Bacteriovorax sp.]|nr:alpha/beta fold hydrolase [Bacteriovorax sp.]
MKSTTLLFLIFLSFILSLNSFAYSKRLKHSECNCVTELQNQLEDESRSFASNYRYKSNSFVKINNDAEMLEGSNKEEAIILIHGFMASPFEVRSIAKVLNDSGYTVYMPLLYGFGGYGEIANQGKVSIWREQIKTSVNKLSRCYKRISLGGISLGAALATDYVLTTHDPKISSLVLMSPYFDISQSVAKLLVGPLSFFKDSVSLSTLFTISRSDDLVEILKNNNFYSDIMPFLTLQELFKLSNELKAKTSTVKSNIPVFLAVSEFDSTIDLSIAESLPANHFNKINLYKIPKYLKVPHQITYESSNSKFDDMTSKIVRFVNRSNLTLYLKNLQ